MNTKLYRWKVVKSDLLNRTGNTRWQQMSHACSTLLRNGRVAVFSPQETFDQEHGAGAALADPA